MTNDLFRFRKFPVYLAAKEFRKYVKQLTKKFPKEEQYCLTSQIWRALDSILLNIAEGSERYSDQDFGRFLNMSLTSLLEVVSGLDGALDDEYLTEEELQKADSMAENIYRQLRAFSSKVRNSS